MAKKTETKAKTRKGERTKPGPKKGKANAAAGAASSAPRKGKKQAPTAATEPKEKQDEATTQGTPQATTSTTETPTPPPTPAPGSPASQETRLPAKGTVLQKRDRQGAVRCECVIVDGGLKYRETVYRSLSAAAIAAAKDLGLAAKAMNLWRAPRYVECAG